METTTKKVIEIDLNSEQGNAFYLLQFARTVGRKIGMPVNEINELRERMMSSDYQNLVNEFDKAFGHFIKLKR